MRSAKHGLNPASRRFITNLEGETKSVDSTKINEPSMEKQQ
jgi:hypothetical protein